MTESKELSTPAAQPAGFDRFIEMAITKNVPVETLERLLAMQKDIMATNAKAAYDDALSAFQKECPIIHKSKEVRNSPTKGGGLRYVYAPMDSIISQVREPLSKHGFSYSADTEIDEKGWIVTKVTSYHIAGHSRTTSFKVPIDKDAFMNEQQKVAAARTYALRYNFVGHFGIMTGDEDDDANSAGDPGAKKSEKPAQTAPRPPASEPAAQKPAAAPTPDKDGKMKATGDITNVEDFPLPKSPGKFRYKITLLDHPKPFYSFDKKVRDLCHEKAALGPATITYHIGKYGQDIDLITFPEADPNKDLQQFIEEDQNANSGA